MILKLSSVSAACICWAVAVSAQGATLTFDDLGSPASLSAIPNNYGGLTWVNMGVITTPSYCSPCGYQNGTVSGSYVAFDFNGSPASFSSGSAFTLNSFYITAAWYDNMTVSVVGKLGAATVQSTSFLISTNAPVFKTLNWSGIDQVQFTTSGGTQHAGYPGSGTHFALDNLTINAVPEPSAWLLMLAGLALTGQVVRRRRA